MTALKHTIFTALFTVLLAMGSASSLMAQSDQQIAQEVMALARAQWQAAIAQRPVAETMKDVADEYTEFDRGIPTRIDGKAMNMAFAEAYAGGGGRLVAADMANPKVQVYGDVAILSYNFVGANKSADGAVEPSLAKSTRVYAKIDGRWQLVHANFGSADDID